MTVRPCRSSSWARATIGPRTAYWASRTSRATFWMRTGMGPGPPRTRGEHGTRPGPPGRRSGAFDHAADLAPQREEVVRLHEELGVLVELAPVPDDLRGVAAR